LDAVPDAELLCDRDRVEWQTRRIDMSARFATNVALTLAGAIVVVASQARVRPRTEVAR
jgi:hypothetical protein